MSIADVLSQIQSIQQQIAQLSTLDDQVPGTGDFASLLATAQNGAAAAATPATTTLPTTATTTLPTGTYATDPTATAASTAATSTTAVAATGVDASPYDSMIVQAAQANGVDPALLKALVRAESNFNPNAVSGAGAIGLTQLMPGTAAGLGVQNAYDPMQSLLGGARYLHNALQEFNGDESLALAAYNAGSGAVRQYGGIPPYSETQSYVPRVLGYAQQFRTEGFGGTTTVPTANAATLPTPTTTAAIPGSAASLAVQGATQAAASPGAQTAISVAQQFLGTPYMWGGSSPTTGFDCSGLVQYAYAQSGVTLPRVAADQYDVGTPVDRTQLQPGDIVFFKDSSGYVHHEGLYLGGGKFLHAPHTGDVVKISSLDEPYYAGQFAGGRRVA
jgi:cell wall-associated NlpC family hydrolase